MEDIRGLISAALQAPGYERAFEWFTIEMGYFDWLASLLAQNAGNLEIEVQNMPTYSHCTRTYGA